MATPTLRDSTSGTTTATISFTVTLPTHAVGDLLVIFACLDKSIGAVSGWTTLTDAVVTPSISDAFLFTRIATSNSTTNPVITSNTSNFTAGQAWVAMAISGPTVGGLVPYGFVELDTETEASGTTAQQGNISSVYDNALAIALGVWKNVASGFTVDTANGWTEQEDIAGSTTGIWLGSKTITAAGAQTGAAVSFTTRVVNWLTFQFIDTNELPAIALVKHGLVNDAGLIGAGVLKLAAMNINHDYLFLTGNNAVSTEFDDGTALVSFNDTVFYTLGVGGFQEDLLVKYGKMDASSLPSTVGIASCYFRGMFILRGGHQTHPFARTGFSWEKTATTTPSAPALNTTHDNQIHLVLVGDGTTTGVWSSAAISGYTKLFSNGNATNGGGTGVFFKEYTSAGDATSVSASSFPTATQLVHSLLITPPRAAVAELPAIVRLIGRKQVTGSTTVTLYNMRAKDGEILLMFAATATTTSQLAFTLSTPSGLTHVSIADNYDSGNGWNVLSKAVELTGDTAADTIAANFTVGHNPTYLHVAVVDRADISTLLADEVINNTAGTTIVSTLASQANAIGYAYAVCLATNADIDADWSEQAYRDGTTNIGVSSIVDGCPDAGDNSHTFTSDTSGKLQVNLVFLGPLASGAGLFGGQDF